MKRFLTLLLTVCLLLGALCARAVAEERKYTPRVLFHITHYVGYVGRNVQVMVDCLNAEVCRGNGEIFELRGADGRVLARAEWQDVRKRLTFVVRVDETMLGGHDLTVWLGDEKISVENGFAAFSDLSVPRVKQLNPREPAIALTIVCGGGSRQQVSDVLAVLDRYQVKATFFFNGDYLRANLEDAKQIVQAGHEIGSHGNMHIHMAGLTDVQAIRTNITAMNRLSEEKLGIRPRLFRAPFSETNEMITAVCRAEGMEEIAWTIDSQDWMDKYRENALDILYRVKGPEAGPGAVIQFHLNGWHTAEVLDDVIPYYQQDCGLRVVPVGELMELSGRKMPPLP